MSKTQFQINKLVMLILVACFLFGAAGLVAPAEALAAKAKDKPEQTIGYINRQQVFASYLGIQDIMKQIQNMRNEAQKDYDARSKDLPDTERKTLNDTISREEAQKEGVLMKPLGDKIEAFVKAVAEEKGLAAVIDASTVVYGGIDITADVISKIKQ